MKNWKYFENFRKNKTPPLPKNHSIESCKRANQDSTGVSASAQQRTCTPSWCTSSVTSCPVSRKLSHFQPIRLMSYDYF